MNTLFWCSVVLVAVLARGAQAQPPSDSITGITGDTTIPMHREWSFGASGAGFVTSSENADNQVALVRDGFCPTGFSLQTESVGLGANSGYFDRAPLARGSRGQSSTLVLGANTGTRGFKIIDPASTVSGTFFSDKNMHYGRFMNANGDHLHDVIGCEGSTCWIALATDFSAFDITELSFSFTGMLVNQVVVADFNDDGIDDVVLPLDTPSVAVAVSTDFNTPGSYSIVTLNTCSQPVVGVLDVDNDGDLDVVATCSGGKLTWWENRYEDDAGFEGGVVLSDPGMPSREVRSLAIADVTNDGAVDVVASTTTPPTLVVYTNSGTGDGWANADKYTFTGTPSHTTVAVLKLMGSRPFVVIGCDVCDGQTGVWHFGWDHFSDQLLATPSITSAATVGEYMVTSPENRLLTERAAILGDSNTLKFYGMQYAPLSHGVAFASQITMSPVWRDVPPGALRLCYNNGGGWTMQSDAATLNFDVSSVERRLSAVTPATVVDGALADVTSDTRWALSRDGEVDVWTTASLPTPVVGGGGDHVLASMGGTVVVIDLSGEDAACTGSSSHASVSPNGRYIAYASTCENIVGAGASGAATRVFLYDDTTAQTTLLNAAGCTNIHTTVVADNGVVAWVGDGCSAASSSHDCPGEPGGDHPYLWDGTDVKHLACSAGDTSVLASSYSCTVALSSSGNALAVVFAGYRPISVDQFTTNPPGAAQPIVFLWDVAAETWAVGSAVSADQVLSANCPALTAAGEYLSYVTPSAYAYLDSGAFNSLYLRDLASYETEWCGMHDDVGSSSNQLGRVTEDGSACVWEETYSAMQSAASRYSGVTPAGKAAYRRFTLHHAREHMDGVVRVDWLTATATPSSINNTPTLVGISGLSGDGRRLLLTGDDWGTFLPPFDDNGSPANNMGLFTAEYSANLVTGAYTPSVVTVGQPVTLTGLPTPYWYTEDGVYVAWALPEHVWGIYCGQVSGETEFFTSDASITLGSSITTEGTHILCASDDGGFTYYAQHSASSLFVQRAPTATEVTAIAPESWEVESTPSLSLTLDKDFPLGAMSSIAFAEENCGTRVGETVVHTNPVTLGTPIATAGAYKVCVSLDAGTSWTIQSMAGVAVTAAATPVGGASGDPHFLGMHGGYYDFAGEPGRVFNLLSDAHMQVNALFVRNEDGLPGNYMAEIGVALGNRTRIAFRRDGRVSIHPLHRTAGDHAPNRALLEGGGVAHWTDTELVVLWDVYRLQLNKYGWARDMARTDAAHLGYRLWVDEHKLRAQGRMETFAPHGVHGVSWRAWSVAVPTGVQGEGILEGVWEDYALASGDLFGTDFAFNQYVEAPCGDVGVPAGEHLSAGPIRAV